jgi:hypothetical protein
MEGVSNSALCFYPTLLAPHSRLEENLTANTANVKTLEQSCPPCADREVLSSRIRCLLFLLHYFALLREIWSLNCSVKMRSFPASEIVVLIGKRRGCYTRRIVFLGKPSLNLTEKLVPQVRLIMFLFLAFVHSGAELSEFLTLTDDTSNDGVVATSQFEVAHAAPSGIMSTCSKFLPPRELPGLSFPHKLSPSPQSSRDLLLLFSLQRK